MNNICHKIWVNCLRLLGRILTKRTIKGQKNILHFHRTVLLDNCKLEIYGDNNVINVAEQARLEGVHFFVLGNNNIIEIKDHVSIAKGSELWIEDSNNQIVVDSYTGFAGDVHVYAIEGKSVTIGSHCLFAKDIDIRTGDSHSIIDVNSGCRTNVAEDILIEENVWVGAHSTILKGSRIPKGCVLGTHSVITKHTENEHNALICGNPAKIIMHNVTWRPERI